MVKSDPASDEPSQSEKILIDLEEVNKGLSDLMTKIKVMTHGPGLLNHIKGFVVDADKVPVVDKVINHVLSNSRAIVKGEKVSKLGELKAPFPFVISGPHSSDLQKKMVMALKEKEFETSSAKDQLQEEAFGTLRTGHIAEEKRARLDFIQDCSVSTYLELTANNVGHPGSVPIKGILKASLRRTRASLESWLKAKTMLREDALRFFQKGNPLVNRLRYLNPLSPGVFDKDVVQDITDQAFHQAKPLRSLLGHVGFSKFHPSSSKSTKRSFSRGPSPVAGPSRVPTPAQKKQRTDFVADKDTQQSISLQLKGLLSQLEGKNKSSGRGGARGGNRGASRGGFRGGNKRGGKGSDKTQRKQ